jgi:HEAT repeat protein
MTSNARRLVIGGGMALVMLLAAAPGRAQISAQQVRERYNRTTKGANLDDFVRNLNSDDPAKRLQGLKSLTESKDPKAIEYIVAAVGDSDMRIKAKAIDALGNLRATDATPVLVQHLFLRDTDPEVKQRILASLGKIGDPRAAKPIGEFLERDLDPAMRGTAIYALGDIGSPESLPLLDKIAETDGNKTIQRLARQAAEKVNYHQAVIKTEAKQPLDTFLKPERPAPPQ